MKGSRTVELFRNILADICFRFMDLTGGFAAKVPMVRYTSIVWKDNKAMAPKERYKSATLLRMPQWLQEYNTRVAQENLRKDKAMGIEWRKENCRRPRP